MKYVFSAKKNLIKTTTLSFSIMYFYEVTEWQNVVSLYKITLSPDFFIDFETFSQIGSYKISKQNF